MHISVWVITPVDDLMELGRAFREAERIAGLFQENNFRTGNPDLDIMPPLHHDHRTVGGRWNGDMATPAGGNWSTGLEAAARPNEVMPRAVITPEGYNCIRHEEDGLEDIRRTLLHWPDNVVILQDWHYWGNGNEGELHTRRSKPTG